MDACVFHTFPVVESEPVVQREAVYVCVTVKHGGIALHSQSVAVTRGSLLDPWNTHRVHADICDLCTGGGGLSCSNYGPTSPQSVCVCVLDEMENAPLTF